ncbi:MAG: hypothetical protein MI806_20545, partial [Minwuiales bacterium]|nr:hypothetical protein [Minwuiales bacterium]
GAIRLVSIERGHDPERFAIMPFGGGGALRAGALMRDVGRARAIVPRYPGVTSALGCVIADMRQDFVHTLNVLLDALDVASLDGEMVRAAKSGAALIGESGAALDGVDAVFELDMSYVGQTHTVAVPLPVTFDGERTGITAETIREAFEATYKDAYGRLLDGLPIRILNLRTAAIGTRPKFDLTLLAPEPGKSADAAQTGERRVWVDGGWHDAAIYARLDLPAGARIPGPAILEQPDTTIFIEPDLTGEVDRFGNLIIERKEP